MNKKNMTYADMVRIYGQEMAFDFLLSMEKMVSFADRPEPEDEEDRLQKALQALDRVSFAA